MREVPTPNFDYDVKKVVKAYEQALRNVQSELNSLFLTDFERAQIIATEENIRSILADIKQYGSEWSTVAITTAATNGIANTIFALGLTETYEEALTIVKFNKTNRRLVAAAIADTQADLLAMTQNIERQAVLAIRRAVAEAMRNQLAQGNNGTQSLSKEIRKQITQATDVAIIDSIGRRWKVSNYAEVIARTKMMEAHKEASINEAISEGAYYGVISRHGATDACAKYEGKIVKLVASAPGDFPYISDLSRKEIFHPNCKHTVSPLRDLSRTSAEVRRINGI